MIVPNGQYYLYRHIRLDNNQPFYIGVGKKNKHQGAYSRAMDRKNRNDIWKGIEKRTDISVEIVLETDDKDFIVKKEIEFISLYGKIISNTGTLANMQNGGMYAANKITPIKEGHPEYQKRIDRLKIINKKRVGSNNFNVLSRQVYVYSLCGGLLFGFDSIAQCADWLGKPFNRYTIYEKIDKGINYFNYIFCSYQKRNIDVSKFSISNSVDCRSKRVAKINEFGEIIKIYETIKEAETENMLCEGTLNKSLKTKKSRLKKQFKYL